MRREIKWFESGFFPDWYDKDSTEVIIEDYHTWSTSEISLKESEVTEGATYRRMHTVRRQVATRSRTMIALAQSKNESRNPSHESLNGLSKATEANEKGLVERGKLLPLATVVIPLVAAIIRACS